MKRFEDKVCIVTGAASGLGRALCERLGKQNANVVAVDINAEGVLEVERMICDKSGQACSFELDVSQFENFEKLMAQIVERFGKIDYIFNNAGIVVSGEMSDLSIDDWKNVIDVNLMGVLYGTIYAYRTMVQQGFGHIVNISSLAGLIGFPMSCPYATSKAGVVGLSTSLRREAEGRGVKVSVVCPGFIDTGIFAAARMINTDKKKIIASLPKLIDPNLAAQKILDGVIKNRFFIVFPFSAKLVWWLYRINPLLLKPLGDKNVKNYRSAKLAIE